MSLASPLRDALKATFYPFASKQGFVRGRATSIVTPFRRMRGGRVQVFEVQWDHNGRPRFVINFGEASADGVEFAGQKVSAQQLDPSQCELQGRLQRWRGGSPRTWFQLSKPWPETLRTFRWEYSPEEVAAQVVSCFSELEAWWANKQEGRHIYIWRTSR